MVIIIPASGMLVIFKNTFTFSDGHMVGGQLNLTQCIAVVPQRGGVEGRGGGTCFFWAKMKIMMVHR